MPTLEDVLTDEQVIDIYFLAAPEDELHCRAIQKYLNPVIRNSKQPIQMYSDFEIPAGQDVATYKQKLYDSEIVLAFISADFINDDATYLRTQKVIERYNNNDTIMLPILVRNCMWKSTPFVNLPLLPKNFQPLNNKQYWNSEDDALTSVASDIYEAIKEYTEEANTTTEKIVAETPAKADLSQPDSETTQMQHEAVQALVDDAILQVEKTPAPAETTPSKPHRSEPSAKKINNIPMDVSWRKDYYKNTLWKRSLAFLLDNLITAIPSVLIAFFTYFFFSGFIETIANPDGELSDISDFEINFVMIASFFFYLVICAIFESSKYKGTFGKQILKLEITDRKGERIGFFKAFFRNLLRVVTAYSYLLIIPLIIQIFTFQKYRKLFHDQISFTVVGEKIRKHPVRK